MAISDTILGYFKGNINNYRDFEMIGFAIFITLIFGIIGGFTYLAFILDLARFLKVLIVFGFYVIANYYILKGL